MILGGAILGHAIMVTAQVIAEPAAYDTIKIYGNSIIDKVRAVSDTRTEQELTLMKPNQSFPWTSTTISYSEFNNDLSSGSIGQITSPIIGYSLYRRRTDGTVFTLISNLGVDDKEFIDYEAKNNKEYLYRLLAKSENEISSPLDADVITANFPNWYLIDEVTKEVFLFDLNLSSGTQSTSSSMKVYESSFTEHPYINHSKNKYMKGKISALAGVISDTTGELVYPQDYLDNLESFVNNGNTKILKDRRGRGWKVRTDAFNVSYMDATMEQLAKVDFDYIEVANLDS